MSGHVSGHWRAVLEIFQEKKMKGKRAGEKKKKKCLVRLSSYRLSGHFV